MSLHIFRNSLEVGKMHEEELDRYFGEMFEITHVSKYLESHGIDRIYKSKMSGMIRTVEYKSDEMASKTGNVFIETVSVDNEDKPGWVFTSWAQVLFYYLPFDGIIYIANMDGIKNKVKKWKKNCEIRKVANDGYYTEGLLIPINEFREACYMVIEMRR